MNDAIHTSDDFFHLHQIGKVGGDKVFVLAEIAWRADVTRADIRIDALQELAQACADIAGSTGDQDFLHDRH